jgi:hypothetical protein
VGLQNVGRESPCCPCLCILQGLHVIEYEERLLASCVCSGCKDQVAATGRNAYKTVIGALAPGACSQELCRHCVYCWPV